jgi:hypothetical protein
VKWASRNGGREMGAAKNNSGRPTREGSRSGSRDISRGDRPRRFRKCLLELPPLFGAWPEGPLLRWQNRLLNRSRRNINSAPHDGRAGSIPALLLLVARSALVHSEPTLTATASDGRRDQQAGNGQSNDRFHLAFSLPKVPHERNPQTACDSSRRGDDAAVATH